MFPVLFSVAGYPVHTYTLLMTAAILGGALPAMAQLRRHPDTAAAASPALGLWTAAGAIAGGKLAWAWSHSLGLGPVWRFWEPGYATWGALGGAVATLTLYLRRRGTPTLPAMDCLMPPLALALGVMRLGCFTAGCCWGRICQWPWAVVFPKDSHAYNAQLERGLIASSSSVALPVHPVQLYFAAGFVTIAVVLWRLPRSFRRPGAASLAFLAMTGALYLAIAPFRGVAPAGNPPSPGGHMPGLLLLAVAAAGALALCASPGPDQAPHDGALTPAPSAKMQPSSSAKSASIQAENRKL